MAFDRVEYCSDKIGDIYWSKRHSNHQGQTGQAMKNEEQPVGKFPVNPTKQAGGQFQFLNPGPKTDQNVWSSRLCKSLRGQVIKE